LIKQWLFTVCSLKLAGSDIWLICGGVKLAVTDSYTKK